MAKKGSPRSGFADMLTGMQDKRMVRLRAKLPSWDAFSEALAIPSDLCLEQCSSESTARYKAGELKRFLGTAALTLADLTGGFGVDSWAFSQVAEKVLYFERNAELATAVAGNYSVLGCSNIVVSCEESTSETIEALPDCDAIFVDPARRSTSGSKVFLLEDCTPDVLTLLPTMCRKARALMLKLSPMADISMVVRRLEAVLGEAKHVREVHVVGAAGEVKELLVLIGAGEGLRIVVADADSGARFEFIPSDEAEAMLSFVDRIEQGMTLLEPKPVLLKAGCFKLPCARISARKLGRDTHLYVSTDTASGEMAAFFKPFEIIEVLPMGNASVKDLGRKYPVAEVSAKGLHLTSDDLRKRLGCKSGIEKDGRHFHIFGCDTVLGKLLIVTAGI